MLLDNNVGWMKATAQQNENKYDSIFEQEKNCQISIQQVTLIWEQNSCIAIFETQQINNVVYCCLCSRYGLV